MRWIWLAVALLMPTGCGAQAGTGSTAPPSVSAALAKERAWFEAPGALALVRSGGQRWSGVSGAADLAGTPITDGTRFRIGSITKPIVATLVLQAVGRGELSLDATVDRLLPGVLMPGPPVTVRMLLNHTSGIFDETNDAPDVAGDIQKIADPGLRAEGLALLPRALQGEPVIASDRLLVALSETHPRYFAPGAGYHYSNINYQLAAMILTRVTGQSPATLLQSGIIAPLGLRHTSLTPPDVASPELRGYDRQPGAAPVDVTDSLVLFGNGGNGGVITTAGELLTIVQAIVSGRLVPKAELKDMETMTPQSLDTYGLGLARYNLACGTYYGHGGSVDGTQSIAIASADGRSGVVAAVNLTASGSDPDLRTLAEQLICPRAGR